jgi:hypothetical protein
MDVPGLAPADRAKLAELYEAAQPFAGERVIRPHDASDERRQARDSLRRRYEPTEADRKAAAPGGVRELIPLSKGGYRLYGALYRGGILTVAAVDAASDADLLALPGIGPATLRDLRAAVAAHSASQEATR